MLPPVRDIRRMGSAALDLCFVACGRLDAYVERGLKPWDLAAAELIVREAGGRVEGIHGAPAGELLTTAGAASIYDRVPRLPRGERLRRLAAARLAGSLISLEGPWARVLRHVLLRFWT